MINLMVIAGGGAVGAVFRYSLSVWVTNLFGRGFPYGTLVVNVVGSLFIGWLYVFLVERASLGSEWRAGLLIGLLGAFTTFSTFSLETINLIEQKEFVKPIMNIMLSIVLCLGATWVGLVTGRQM